VSSPLAPHLPAPVHDHTLFKQRDVCTFAHFVIVSYKQTLQQKSARTCALL
jgi:hypothetical protein